jgi:uncharacterized protein (DUF4415 family)
MPLYNNVAELRLFRGVVSGELTECGYRGASRAIAPINPPLTREDFARMRPAIEVAPELVRRMRGQRGPQKSKPVKSQLTLRLDPDVIAHFRSLGPGWQARINEALRKAAGLKKRA